MHAPHVDATADLMTHRTVCGMKSLSGYRNSRHFCVLQLG